MKKILECRMKLKILKNQFKLLDEDISREKGIIIDANSNEKRLKEEKTELIDYRL